MPSDPLHPATLLVQAEAEYAYYEAWTRSNEANENQQGSICELNRKQISHEQEVRCDNTVRRTGVGSVRPANIAPADRTREHITADRVDVVHGHVAVFAAQGESVSERSGFGTT